MKIGICAASIVNIELDKSLDYIGVDHGIDTLLNQGIKPLIGIGDFDSITNINNIKDIELIKLPVEKDITDSEYALNHAIKLGYDEIELYGVTGGRLDHFLAVMCLLEKYASIKIKIIDKQNIIQLLLPGNHVIKKDDYKYFSIFAVDKTLISLNQCKYPLINYLLTRDNSLCVSNEVVGKNAVIYNTNNIIIIKSKEL